MFIDVCLIIKEKFTIEMMMMKKKNKNVIYNFVQFARDRFV